MAKRDDGNFHDGEDFRLEEDDDGGYDGGGGDEGGEEERGENPALKAAGWSRSVEKVRLYAKKILKGALIGALIGFTGGFALNYMFSSGLLDAVPWVGGLAKGLIAIFAPGQAAGYLASKSMGFALGGGLIGGVASAFFGDVDKELDSQEEEIIARYNTRQASHIRTRNMALTEQKQLLAMRQHARENHLDGADLDDSDHGLPPTARGHAPQHHRGAGRET